MIFEFWIVPSSTGLVGRRDAKKMGRPKGFEAYGRR